MSSIARGVPAQQTDLNQNRSPDKEPNLDKKYCQCSEAFLRFFNFVLEAVAIYDLVTDIQVSIMMWSTPYHGWLTINLISMFMPYYISYGPFLLYLREQT